MPDPLTRAELCTPAGLLRHLLAVNRQGVWFVQVEHDRYVPLPKWLWPFCLEALPDAERLEGADDGS